MTEKTILILIICLIGLLVIMPASAKKVTAKVDDKGLVWYNGCGLIGTLHTQYGTITVSNEDYNNIMVNDTITYDTNINTFWSPYWKVKKN